MRLKHFLSVFLTLLTLSVGQMWGTEVTIASWSAASRTANNSVSPTSSQTDNTSARLKSECELSTAGTGGATGSYYGTWTNDKCIYITGLNLSGYTGISLTISNFRRTSASTANFYASTNGSTLLIREDDSLKIKGEMNFKLENISFKIKEVYDENNNFIEENQGE